MKKIEKAKESLLDGLTLGFLTAGTVAIISIAVIPKSIMFVGNQSLKLYNWWRTNSKKKVSTRIRKLKFSYGRFKWKIYNFVYRPYSPTFGIEVGAKVNTIDEYKRVMSSHKTIRGTVIKISEYNVATVVEDGTNIRHALSIYWLTNGNPKYGI